MMLVAFDIDPKTLSGPAQKILDPAGPAPLRAMAAKALAPGLKPAEALTVCVLLSVTTDGPDAALGETARATLAKLPGPILNGALAGQMHPGVLHVIAPKYASDVGISEKLVAHANIQPETIAEMAGIASEAVCELIATNEQLMLSFPKIIEKLYMNRNTRMSTADRIVELAVRNDVALEGIPAFEEAKKALDGQLITEASDEPNYDDQLFAQATAEDVVLEDGEDTHEIDEATGQEVVKKKVEKKKVQFDELTISGKIRAALLGKGGERLLAVRDPNPLVRAAAIKSPLLTENEVQRITANKNTNEDIMRMIAANRDWMRDYRIKYNIVMNPRTPLAFAMRYITHLRDNDLKILGKSRDVAGAVREFIKGHQLKKGG